MRITWNGRDQFLVNIQMEKVKKERILLKFLLHLHLLIILQVEVLKAFHKHKNGIPLLKLDVKFKLPMYDCEVNAERLDNWVIHMEVYCSVQQIKDEATQIKLASLRLAGTTLMWWKKKLQNGTQQVGNVFPSWQSFISALRKQFCPLGYK
jgi:hypothetical protein